MQILSSFYFSQIRSDATEEELGELTKTNNPEEINIDDDDIATDEEEEIEGKHWQTAVTSPWTSK